MYALILSFLFDIFRRHTGPIIIGLLAFLLIFNATVYVKLTQWHEHRIEAEVATLQATCTPKSGKAAR